MSLKRVTMIAVFLSVVLSTSTVFSEQSGKIIGWGEQVVGVDLDSGFVAVGGGRSFNLGLEADGSVVAWGKDDYGQCDVPIPNANFVAVAAGGEHSLGLKADGSVVAWGRNQYGQC